MSNVVELNNLDRQEHRNLKYETRAQFLANIFDGKKYVVTCITDDQEVHSYIGEGLDAAEVALLQKYMNQFMDTVL